MRQVVKIASPLLGMIVVSGLMFVPKPQPKKAPTMGQTYCKGSTPCVLTYHNNNNRDGSNPNEGAYTAATLNSTNHPTPKWLATTDGEIYAQPLYIHQLLVNGSTKNVVFVATENNSVYAMDSDSVSTTGTVLTTTNLNNASDLPTGSTEIAVPSTDILQGCNNIIPEVGISGTAVIDISVTPPVLYLVTKHEDVDSQGGKTFRQKLHGLYADTLQEIPGSPLVLDSAFAAQHTNNVFTPLANNQRAGLALVTAADGSAKIWVTWGSHCDEVPYHGFAIEFNYQYQNSAFANTYTVFDDEASCVRSRCQAGIWMGGAAPAADEQGNVFLSTGNGDDTHQGAGEYSNSILKLNDGGLLDYYSPPDFDGMNNGNTLVACANPGASKCAAPCKFDSTGQYCQVTLVPEDWDLGAAGVILLKPTFAMTNPELVTSGKQGMTYVMFAGNLGQLDAHVSASDRYACTTATTPTPGSIVQCFMGATLHNNNSNPDSGGRGGPVFLGGRTGPVVRNYLYVAGVDDILKAYHFQNSGGIGTFNGWASTPLTPHKFEYPGAVLAITWQHLHGNVNDALVWALDTHGYGTLGKAAAAAEVYVYKAIPPKIGGGQLGAALWDSTAYDTTVPGSPGAVKFMTPTIVDGKLLLAGGAQGYRPGSANCPAPSTTVQPTACGGLAMFK